MYYELECNGLVLEYINERITLTYKDMFVILEGYAINNFITVLYSLYDGININSFSMDGLTMQYDKDDTLYIGNGFFIETDNIADLITLFSQSEALRLNLVRPKNVNI